VSRVLSSVEEEVLSTQRELAQSELSALGVQLVEDPLRRLARAGLGLISQGLGK